MELLTIKEASALATSYVGRDVTLSNISYLIQYGRLRKIGENGFTQVLKQDLIRYLESRKTQRQAAWQNRLGKDLNWALSFEQYKESETTKHVHRLHPYKGKFIPQLVEYFLDNHIDKFKKKFYFQKGDLVLDPFCGSGTLLVQASELGMNAIGIDISTFNALISNGKIKKYDISVLRQEIQKITNELDKYIVKSNTVEFERELLEKLYQFNNKYFPSPEYRYSLEQGKINEFKYGYDKEKQFLEIYKSLIKKYQIKLKQDKTDGFLGKWYIEHVRKEIDFAAQLIDKIKEPDIRSLIKIILSRTIHSCRATTHSDLATLKEPVLSTYYCVKHGKICKPLFSILSWWKRYAVDTISRLNEFDKLRTKTSQMCLTGDSKTIDIIKELEKENKELANLAKSKKIKGIFSSPPYVGLIDYHEQHAYAYDLFKLERRDGLEIGPLYNGQGQIARNSYVNGISDVLNNCKKYLAEDYDVFLVANDKYNLYPTIAENCSMRIVGTASSSVGRIMKARELGV